MFLVSLSFSVTYGLYFHIGEIEKKCFIEDIPDDTLVVGETKILHKHWVISLSDFLVTGVRIRIELELSKCYPNANLNAEIGCSD